MDFPGFLAMTGAEIANCGALPPRLAYMSCHFSPYGTGLSALPPSLPAGSVLMLTDRTPISGHDPCRIAGQLGEAAERLGCSALVLDLQRHSDEAPAVVEAVLGLGCPVVVSQRYALGLDCAVLVDAPLLWTPLSETLEPWKGREVWLETVCDSALVTVTETGSRYEPFDGVPADPRCDEAMHVLYEEALQDTCARFRLWRTEAQLPAFVEEARLLGVTEFLGLWQQLRSL